MSNPFLDSSPFQEAGDAPCEPPQRNGKAGVGGVNKPDPLCPDLLLGEEYPGQPSVQSTNSHSHTLLDFAPGVTDPGCHVHSDGLVAEDMLLDLGDCGVSGGGSGEVKMHDPPSQSSDEGLVDLLGSSDSQFSDSVLDIPPPMQFSNPSVTAPSSRANTYSTPVTNIDDLLGLDFLSDLDPVSHDETDSELSKGSSSPSERGYGDGFDLLPDLRVARDPMVSDGSLEEEGVPPKLPSEPPPPVPTEPPPPLPTDPPPDVATDLHSAVLTEPVSDVSEDSLSNVATDTSSADLIETSTNGSMATPLSVSTSPQNHVQTPSISADLAMCPSPVSNDTTPDAMPDSPPDLPEDRLSSDEASSPPTSPVNSMSSLPTGTEDDGVSNITTELNHEEDLSASNTTTVFLPSQNPSDNVTQISVTSASVGAGARHKNNNSNNNTIYVTDITVSSPASNTSAVTVTRPKPSPRGPDFSKAFPGAAVVTVDNSSTPSSTHIQFDNSTQETVVKSTLPPDAFMPTSVGITKTVKPSSQGSGEEEDEEEEITPMMVHRDHQGNKMAAPSPPETLGRQFNGPRKLDEEAKHDLQTVLSRMTEVSRSSVKKKESEEDVPTVTEEEIVPVKMTRQEAETAQDVLSKWLNKEPGASVRSPPARTNMSGFQKVVGTVINIQLPNNSVFLTTMGVTKTSSSKEGEVEEDIIPMSLHKDHLGNKHYAPSPPESLGRQSGIRQLDSAAKQDMAQLLSGMASTRKSSKSLVKEASDDVREEEIVATVLSRDQSRLATEAVTRWLEGEKDRPLHKPSPFQRLVENVMDSTSKTQHTDATDSSDQMDHIDTPVEHQGQSSVTNEDSTAQHVQQDLSQSVEPQATVSAPVPKLSAPTTQVFQQTPSPLADPDLSSTVVVQQTSSLLAHSKPSSKQTPSQPTTDETKTLSEEPKQNENTTAESEARSTRIVIKDRSTSSITSVETKPSASQRVSGTTIVTTSADAKSKSATRTTAAAAAAPAERKPKSSPTVTATSVTAVETKHSSAKRVGPASSQTKPSPSPKVSATISITDGAKQSQPSQRGLRAPSKITSLSQTTSTVSSKPLSKLGSLSVANRVPVTPLASSRLSPRLEYGKTRNDQSPFLVEVLKGIVGLGIKVKVNNEGHVEVTEVQRNSPVNKNGNVKVGDYVLFINTTELRGLTDGRVQQLLRLLPRGLVKLVVSTRPPPPLTVPGHESGGQKDTKTGGAYSQFGVRLSPRPFSPSSSDGQSSPLTSPLVQDAVTLPDHLSSTTTTTTGAPSLTSSVTQDPVASPAQPTPDFTPSTRAPEREGLSSTQGAVTPVSSETTVTASAQKETVSAIRNESTSEAEAVSSINTSSTVPELSSPSYEREATPVQKLDSSHAVGETGSFSSPPRQSKVRSEDERVPSAGSPSQEARDSSVVEDQEDAEDDDMASRRLSKALSPRHITTDQSHASEAAPPHKPTPKPESAATPKPTPRQRASLPPTSLAVSQKESGAKEEQDQDHGQGSPQRHEHKLTPSEIVAAASRRPSARDDDLLSSLSSSWRDDGLHRERSKSSRDVSQVMDSTNTFRSTVRVESPREESFKGSVHKTSPVPTPRHRSRTVEERYSHTYGDRSPRGGETHSSVKNEAEIKQRATADRRAEGSAVVHASVVTIVPESAPPRSEASQPEVSSPKSRRPRHLPHAEDAPRDLPSPSPSPTLVSSRLRAFADPDAPTLEDQAQNRKFVSSAARMFEQKASENNSPLPFARPNKSSVSVSSMVKSMNTQEPESSSYGKSGVTMRKKSVGVVGRADRGSSYSSSLAPVSERRKSMPSPLTESTSLSVPQHSNLSHLKNLSSSTVTLSSEQADRDSPARVNSALTPRQSRANTTSLKSVMASRDNEDDWRAQSPPSVGKSRDSKRTSMLSEVTLRSRTSVHDPHSPSSQSNRKSWSPLTTDSLSTRSHLTSRSLHRNDRLGYSMTSLNSPDPDERLGSPTSSLSSPRRHDRLGSSMTSLASSRWSSRQAGTMDSAIKKFDDLVSDKPTLATDDELPKVSNSVCLDFKSRAADRPEVRKTALERSAGGAEVPKKSWRQSPPEPLSVPRSSSPLSSVPKSPDMVLVEERRTLKKGDKHTKQTEGLVQTHTADFARKGMTSEQTNADEAAVSCIITKGLKGQTPVETGQERDKDQLRMKTLKTESQQTADQIQPQIPIVHANLVSADSAPKDKTRQSKSSQIVDEDRATQEQQQQNHIVSKRKVVESKDYSEKYDTASVGKTTLTDAHQDDSAKSPELPGERNYNNPVASIVQTVISETLKGDNQGPKEDENKPDDDDDDDSPPPLPDEGPPPLPGAPPPPLAVRRDVDMLVDVENLEEMVASQERPASPSSQQGLGKLEAQSTVDLPTVRSEDLEVDDTAKTGISASLRLPLQQPVPDLTQAVQNNEQKSVTNSDVMVPSPSTPPPHPLSPPTSTNLLVEGDFRGKEEAENGQDNPPVSDTLSQDSGVQDEDMSEDGLRFSMDDSPITTSLFDTSITPDDPPPSVMNESQEGPQDGQGRIREGQAPVEDPVPNVQIPHKPVPAPRRNVAQASSSSVSPSTPLTATKDSTVVAVSQNRSVVSGSQRPAGEVDRVNDSVSQGSVSPRCSSDQRATEAVLAPGGVSTTGNADGVERRRHKDSLVSASSADGHNVTVKTRVVTESRTHGGDFSKESKVYHTQLAHTEQKGNTRLTTATHHQQKENTNKADKLETDTHTLPKPRSSTFPLTEDRLATDSHKPQNTRSTKLEKLTTHSRTPAEPQSPTSPTTEDDEEDDEEDDDQEESSTPNSVRITCSRKWCILDQSGSLFLQGPSSSPVDVARTMLRQVSSLHPGQLEEMLGTASRDLDEAKVPLTVELRVVAARALDGTPVSLDVVQREDYFVQVTRVHTKDSSIQEADLLLSVDGHAQRHRRPAMVHSHLNNTGPKGVLLIARGVKLPSSVAVVIAADEAMEDRPRTVSVPSPVTSRTPGNPSMTSVQIEPGVYEITMNVGSTGVGFCLEGGKASTHGDMPILIKRIFKGGPAEKGGVLKVKDEILSFNGVDFTTLRHYDAWKHLKDIKDTQITLRIRRAE